MIDLIVQHTDPVNAVMLIIIWWRLERYSGRINRLESKLLNRKNA